ncbi:MAG: ATP-dependent DNA helicase RecQ [Planctomycetota bacterium]
MTETDVENGVTPAELLKKQFGWDEFLEGQEAVISRLLAGRSSLAVFPTGGGKSLCYQLPALAFDGLTLVVSPLIALMKDQIDSLREKGIAAVRIDSTLSRDEYQAAMEQVKNGEAKLLYVAPERMFNERFRVTLEQLPISLFAIDEAHCISQWGHNFRPDYLKMAPLVEQIGFPPVLALTATATPAVQQDIRAAFDIDPDDAICTPFFRPNLHLRSAIVSEDNQLDELKNRLATNEPGPAIVYVTLQKTAETVADACAGAGINARAYHAGLDAEKRNEIQQWFMDEPAAVIVATIAFGMGIDKSDIRYVYHFNPPKSLENYAQEIGRAGRDGLVSRCEMLLNPADRIALENFVYGDTPTRKALSLFIGEIASQPDNFHISHYRVANKCDIRSTVLRTLLTYLELEGWLVATSPRYDSYSFKPLVPSKQIVDAFEGERKNFATGLLACSEKKRVWFEIDIPAAMERLACDRQRVVAALEYFSEQGWMELKVSGLVHGYRKLKQFDSPRELVDRLSDQSIAREQAELSRIDQIFDLATASSCQAAQLSSHFGQPLDQTCGECSSCIGEGPIEVSESEPEHMSPEVMQLAIELSSAHHDAMPCARTTARFLCGITSPGLSRAKLTRHDGFGCCSHIPMGEILRQLQAAGFQAG